MKLIELFNETLNTPVNSYEGIGLVVLCAFLVLIGHLTVLFIVVKMGKKNDKKNLTVLGHGHNVEFVRDSKSRRNNLR